MSSARKILPNYTHEDYLRWEGRWEIIDGIAYDMSPMPTPKHQRVASNLNILLGDILTKSKKCNCTVYHPLDLKIDNRTIVNPDLLIVCRPIEKQYLDFPPELVVEIHSPSTILKDKITKFDLYQEFGIKYYLMIDPDKETIVILRLNAEGKYEDIETTEFDLTDGCKINVDLSGIW